MRHLLLVIVGALASSACDNREAIQMPEPTLARMLEQRRADPYGATSAFPDGKVMQRPPAGTVAVEDDSDDPPPPVTRELLELGRARFDVTCAVCHGLTGTGESVVATKMTLRAPPSIVDDENRARSRQDLHRIVTEGYGLMPSYSEILSGRDRWAVASYVQALQLSRHAVVADLPEGAREHLAKEPR